MHTYSSLFITHTDLALPHFHNLSRSSDITDGICSGFVCVCMCFSLSDLLHSSLYWLLSSTPTPDQQFLYFWNDLSAPSNGHACIHKDAVIQHFQLNANKHAQTFTHASNHLVILCALYYVTWAHACSRTPFPSRIDVKSFAPLGWTVNSCRGHSAKSPDSLLNENMFTSYIIWSIHHRRSTKIQKSETMYKIWSKLI